MTRWLIVVDIQNDFGDNGQLAATGWVSTNDNVFATRVIEFANKYSFDRIIPTQDFHPPNHVSFCTSHGKEPFTEVLLCYNDASDVNPVIINSRDDAKTGQIVISQVLWPPHCIQNTNGVKFFPAWDEYITKNNLKVQQKGDKKYVDSYSAFWDNGHISHTKLLDELIEEKPDEVVIVGIATDYCCAFSAVDCYNELIKVHPSGRVIVIEDLTRSVSHDRDIATDVIRQVPEIQLIKSNNYC